MEKNQRGFTLLELLVASSLGVLLILAMTSLFKMGMDATFTISQRIETQQNMRAAVELITKDISLAGAGLPSGGLQLVSGTGTSSQFACNQTGTCYVPNNTYPNGNFMTGLIPGFSNGVQGGAAIPNAAGQTNDSITSVYCDYNFPLSNFLFSFPSGVQSTVQLVAVPDNTLPTNILSPGGLVPGDLLMFIVSTPGNGTGTQGTSSVQNAAVVAEVTSIPNNTTINFANGDALQLNQGGGGNNLATVQGAIGGANARMTVCRLYAVTYFLQVPAAGGTVETPRLMRQVNGYDAVPIADNIINLQFSYDVINNAGGVSPNVADPLGSGDALSQIQKVNMWVMGESLTSGGKRSQNMYLATQVSARNMSFCNSYGANGC
ncbi:MAG TPA: prepilin-type N-terminal cleavage/methylation domain-containing protein [Candidatus Sulfotelmatobacter sp.]